MELSPRKRQRHPAVPVATAFGAGILADHWLDVPLEIWLSAWGSLLLAWILAQRRFPFLSLACVLLSVAAFGGVRHHSFWSNCSPNDLSLFAGQERKLIRLAGKVADQPEIIASAARPSRAAWARHERTTATLDCLRILGTGLPVAVSGRASLVISGRVEGVDVGDEIEICGWLSPPRAANNPDGFDLAIWLRRQGIHCVVAADDPAAVTRIRRASEISPWRWAARVRAQGEALFHRDLSPRTAPVAAALLFGSRSEMEEDIREAFRQSGMLHALAISGVHVGILALLLWGVARLGRLSIRDTCLVTALGVVAYTFVTDCRPPVVRATVFICLCMASRIWFRKMALANGLALAAIVVLAWNPTDLFDVGTQLSFLGVLAILWATTWIRQADHRRASSILLLPAEDPPWRRRIAEAVLREARNGWWISIAAALFTMPLVAARFHLVSPIGVVINVVLSPLSTVVLWLGYLHAGVGLAIPQVSPFFAFPFDLGLKAFVALVEAAARVKMSHACVGGPPEWWLAGYYAILISVAFAPALRDWGCRRWSALAAWTILGLVCGLRSSAPGVLRCTFLAVGHGGATLIETPSGRTLLYDGGAIPDGRIAERSVQTLLWHSRHRSLDAIVVSHADVDHFNGVPGLMGGVPVGVLFVSQQFLDFDQPAVAALCDASSQSSIPIRLIRDGDRLLLDEAVTITVLHPPPGPPLSDDNANSATLLLEYGGRRILLTGDLEGTGQASLLERPPCHVDVLQAPHHGSRKANNARLAEWARPDRVIVSAGPRVDWRNLESVYAPAELLSTDTAGAVTFEVHPDGELRVTTVRIRAKCRSKRGLRP